MSHHLNLARIRVWRSASERFHPSCLTPSSKSGRQTVMVWGCFMCGKRGLLVVFPKGGINGEVYVTILEETLMGYWMAQSEERGQEDNAPIHTCKLAKQWKESVDMEILPWPPNSPDLYLIEH